MLVCLLFIPSLSGNKQECPPDLHGSGGGQWRALVNTVLKCQVPKRRGISSLFERLCSKELCHLSELPEARRMQTCRMTVWLARQRTPSVHSSLTST